MVALGVVLLVGGTTTSPSDAAVRVPERAAPIAATTAQDGRWAGPLPDTNYPVPTDAIHVAVACTEQPEPPCGDDGDDRDGSAQEPVATLEKAIERVQAGKTIVMHDGDYRESLGAVVKPFILQPYPHATVWLKGSILHTAWTKQSGVNEWKADGWTSPFCIDEEADPPVRDPAVVCYNPAAVDTGSAAGLPEQVFMNGLEFTQVTDRSQVAGHSRFFVDPTTGELVIGLDPAHTDMELSQHAKAFTLQTHWNGGPGASGAKVFGIGFTHYAPHWHEDELGAVVVQAEDVTFEGNTVVGNAGTGVAATWNPGVYRNNNVSRNGYRGMVVHYADGSVLEGNTIDRNNTQRFKIDGCGSTCTVAAVKATHTTGLRVTNNRFTNTYGAGFWCDVACLDADIVANTASNNIGAGIFYEISDGGFIAFNRIVNTKGHDRDGDGDSDEADDDQFSAGVKVANSPNVEIIANTFTNNHRQLALFDGDRDEDCDAALPCQTTGTLVVQNTFLHTQPGKRRLLTTMAHNVYADQMFDEVEDISGNLVQRPDDQEFHWVTEQRHWIYPSLAKFEDPGPDGAKIDGKPIDFGSAYTP
jgi:parallel beta-helix repeat protein